MDAITHGNIAVAGIPFTKILSMHILHTINSHASCEITGELESDRAQDIVDRIDELTLVEVSTTTVGQPAKLFVGVVQRTRLQKEAEHAKLTLDLAGVSVHTDLKKIDRTYQNTAKTYQNIIDECLNGQGVAAVTITDQPIGQFIVQDRETNWEFIMRMASKLGVPIFTDITAVHPFMFIGLPPSDDKKLIQSTSYGFGKDDSQFIKTAKGTLIGEDFSSLNTRTFSYVYLGNLVEFNQKNYRIKSVSAHLIDGTLESTLQLVPQSLGAGAGSSGAPSAIGGFTIPEIKNPNCGGKMYSGAVAAVSGNKVQVNFDMDSEFAADSTKWFDYSTAYSSQDGSGWYCMPEVEDIVRVFFPSDNEEDAFAASSACRFPQTDPTDKCWITPDGKQITLSKKGILICCEKDELFIDLTDENGVCIYSNTDIKLIAKKMIELSAETVTMNASNNIVMGTDKAFIDISEGNITLAGDSVWVQ